MINSRMCVYIYFLLLMHVCLYIFNFFLVLFDSITDVTPVRVYLYITHICTHTGVTLDVCGCECGCGGMRTYVVTSLQFKILVYEALSY
jgi:hypothetical protein